jgi:signal transduction histidine kinase
MKENEIEILSLDRKRRNKILRFAVLGVLCFFMAAGVHFFSGTVVKNNSSVRTNAEAFIKQKETLVQELLDRVYISALQNPNFASIHGSLPEKLWEKEGVAIFVYQDDSLIYWSDNSVPELPFSGENSFPTNFIRHVNGWYDVIRFKKDGFNLIGLIHVKYDYPYQNEYLVNSFRKELGLDWYSGLDTAKGEVNIYNSEGNFLFSLEEPGKEGQNRPHEILIFGLSSAALIFFLLMLFYLYHLFDFFRKYPLLLFGGFLIDAILLRFLTIWLKFPGFLYNTDLFGPYHYATSFISPSLGDLVINSFFWLLLASLFYKQVRLDISGLSIKLKVIAGLAMSLASAGLFYLLITTLKRMIVDSSFELNLNNIFNIDVFSALGFLAIASQFMAFFLVSAKFAGAICKSGLKGYVHAGISFIAALCLMTIFSLRSPVIPNLIYPALFFVYLLSFLYFSSKASGFRNISGALYFIVLFSVTGTFVLDYYQEIKEREKRRILAAELSSKRDPMMEFEFGKLRDELLSDTTLSQLATRIGMDSEREATISDYLKNKYFNIFWTNYELLTTVCTSDEILEIQPSGYLVNCFDYFDGLLVANNADTVASGLYFFNNRSESNNYIATFDIPAPGSEGGASTRIIVELYYKYIKETGLGYPDLLIDKKAKMISGLSNYSYSRYFNGSLVYKYGDFSYHLSSKPYQILDSSAYFVDIEGFNHYVSITDDDNVLIISRKNPTWLDLVAPFSYLFILFSLFLLIYLLFRMFPDKFRDLDFSFSNRLQLSIILIIVVSFIILGLISRSRIIHQNTDMNRDILSEKTYSILTELEHKIGEMSEISPDMQPYLEDLLYKFSLIFYSDINLYDPSGTLLASSRPQIFEEGLLSGKMNTEAFHKLAVELNLLYIQNEKIGLQEYLSAYIPFRNNEDQIVAYLNLPYFAKQTEIRKEISDFLVAFINVYVLLIVLAIMTTIVVSRFVTRPLQLIREKLGRVGLGKTNEKIEWERKDEIGSLIEEYNRMVDELSRSAELLAQSERESAWREMARQVAHEIKNPLTPMKLSVQYLKKAWDEKTPDWEARLDKFSRTIIEQIDSLSQIASEFSDFAKMPVAHLEKIELVATIKDAVNLYQGIDNVHFSEDYEEKFHYVKADKRQLLRVFNNLMQNAVQAIGSKENGRIGIRVRMEDGYHIVEITDNGTGISEAQATRMFTPSFTTKSSGMGLGLAMVKSIITSIGGTVSFISAEGEGATFILRVPEYRAE